MLFDSVLLFISLDLYIYVLLKIGGWSLNTADEQDAMAIEVLSPGPRGGGGNFTTVRTSASNRMLFLSSFFKVM